MNRNTRLGKLFGVPFYVDPMWFSVLSVVTCTYAIRLAAQFLGLGSGLLPLLLELVTVLLIYASVLAHQLGYSFVAIKQGISGKSITLKHGISEKSITLFLFGGLATLEKESKTPAEAFWVAIAGPLVSILLFGILTAINTAIPLAAHFAAVLKNLADFNLFLAAFVLIPGLPLNGGFILKALVWKITGSRYRGVVFASRGGKIIGWLAIASGLILIPIYRSFSWVNIVMMLAGCFFLLRANCCPRFTTAEKRLNNLTVADAVTSNISIVSESLSLEEASRIFKRDRNNWHLFLVVDDVGQYVGTTRVDELKEFPKQIWATTQVKDLKDRSTMLFLESVLAEYVLQSNQSLLEAAMKLEHKSWFLPVVREDRVLIGILEESTIRQLLQKKNAS